MMPKSQLIFFPDEISLAFVQNHVLIKTSIYICYTLRSSDVSKGSRQTPHKTIQTDMVLVHSIAEQRGIHYRPLLGPQSGLHYAFLSRQGSRKSSYDSVA
jgi:hypothetical protein